MRILFSSHSQNRLYDSALCRYIYYMGYKFRTSMLRSIILKYRKPYVIFHIVHIKHTLLISNAKEKLVSRVILLSQFSLKRWKQTISIKNKRDAIKKLLIFLLKEDIEAQMVFLYESLLLAMTWFPGRKHIMHSVF